MKKGMGSVTKRGEKYYARWRVSGKTVYGPARDSFEEADRDRVNSRPGTQTKLPPGYQPTLQEWAFWCMNFENERYGLYGRGLAASTFETNETIRLVHLEGSALGKKKLRAIEKVDLEIWREQITKHSTKNGRRTPTDEPASASWQNRCMAFVSRILSLAHEHRFISESPAQFVKSLYCEERQNRILSAEEAGKFFPPQDRTDLLIITLIATGLRRGEIARMQWSDLNSGNLLVKSTRNKGGTKVIPIPANLCLMLEAQPKRSTFVFSADTGKPLLPRNITRDVKKRLAANGIPKDARLQDFRGTFLTLLLQAGVDIKTVQTMARHANPRTTMNSYVRSTTQSELGAVQAIEGILGLGQTEEQREAK